MMQATWHLLLGAAVVLLVAGLAVSESRSVPSWPAPPATLGSGFLFLVASIQSSSIDVRTDTGIETVSEPTIGIIAGIMGVVAFVLALVMTVRWFPTPGDANGI